MASDPTTDPPIIWRTKLRSLKPGVNHAKQVAHCIDGGRVGIGWGIEELPSGTPLADVVQAIRAKDERGWGLQAASTVRLFGEEAALGDFIWTRDLEGRFRLARSPVATATTTPPRQGKQTPTRFARRSGAKRPLGDLEVPGAIIRAFSGTSTSFSRMWNTGARIYTAWIWEKLHGREPHRLDFSPAEVLQQLEPYDLEDLIYTWMQVSGGYLALPKARRTDTPAYEWTMLHRETHTPAIVQVKSGGAGVDLTALAAAAPNEHTTLFAYSAAGIYTGAPPKEVTCIETNDLLGFVVKHTMLLPPRVRTWFELAQPATG